MAGQIPRTNDAPQKLETIPSVQTTLSEKRKKWLDCLHGNDENAIQRQIYGLLWDLRSWWTINCARGLTPRDDNGDPKSWRLLHGLLNRCFVTKQMVTVRRLCDRCPFEGKYEVWSLVSLLGDMKDHAHFLTRKAIFEEEGIRYDLAAIERDVERELRARVSQSVIGNSHNSSTSALIEQGFSERLHEEVDRLAGVASVNRAANDQVCPELFDKLTSRLKTTCEDTCQKVNKFLAHAATPNDRPDDLTSSQAPAALFDSARALKETFDFVSRVVGAQGMSLPEGELVDMLEYIECPLVCKEDVPKVRHVWDETGQKLSASFADLGEFIAGLG